MNIEELIADKVDNLFREIQNELNIISGDISPEDQLKLNNLQDELSALIYQIIDYQEEYSID